MANVEGEIMAKPKKSPPLTRETFEIALILDDAITAERWIDVLPRDAGIVLDAALVEYGRQYPKAWTLAKRRGHGWYEVACRVRIQRPLEMRMAVEYTWHCKFCRANLASTSNQRGESYLARPFVEKLDRHCLGCAVDLVIDVGTALYVPRRPFVAKPEPRIVLKPPPRGKR
jgi:hypothetical protein